MDTRGENAEADVARQRLLDMPGELTAIVFAYLPRDVRTNVVSVGIKDAAGSRQAFRNFSSILSPTQRDLGKRVVLNEDTMGRVENFLHLVEDGFMPEVSVEAVCTAGNAAAYTDLAVKLGKLASSIRVMAYRHLVVGEERCPTRDDDIFIPDLSQRMVGERTQEICLSGCSDRRPVLSIDEALCARIRVLDCSNSQLTFCKEEMPALEKLGLKRCEGIPKRLPQMDRLRHLKLHAVENGITLPPLPSLDTMEVSHSGPIKLKNIRRARRVNLDFPGNSFPAGSSFEYIETLEPELLRNRPKVHDLNVCVWEPGEEALCASVGARNLYVSYYVEEPGPSVQYVDVDSLVFYVVVDQPIDCAAFRLVPKFALLGHGKLEVRNFEALLDIPTLQLSDVPAALLEDHWFNCRHLSIETRERFPVVRTSAEELHLQVPCVKLLQDNVPNLRILHVSLTYPFLRGPTDPMDWGALGRVLEIVFGSLVLVRTLEHVYVDHWTPEYNKHLDIMLQNFRTAPHTKHLQFTCAEPPDELFRWRHFPASK